MRTFGHDLMDIVKSDNPIKTAGGKVRQGKRKVSWSPIRANKKQKILSQNQSDGMQNGMLTPSSTPRRGRTTTRGTSRSRSRSDVSMRSRTPSRSRSRASTLSSMAATETTNINVKASKRKGNKVHREGVKPKVRVSKAFRKKTLEVLKTKGPVGTMMEIHTNLYKPNDSQRVDRLGHLSQNIIQHFDPLYVNHVASCLFNRKQMTLNPQSTDNNLFTLQHTQIEVLKQSVTFRMKNNTVRNMTIRVFDVSPKGKQLKDVNGVDPVEMWFNGFAAENQILGPPLTLPGQVTGVNINNITPNTLYAHPKMCKGFKDNYTIDETIYQLEPGKECIHKLVGKNGLYDYQKYKAPSASGNYSFINQQSFVKMTFIVFHLDLIATTLASQGRYTDIIDNSPIGLIVESTYFTKVKMPDQTGFVPNQDAAGNQQLNQRKAYPYIIQNWAGEQQGGVVGIADEQPATVPPAGEQ